MSPLDTFMFDWFGDTLFNVLLFNIVLFGPGAFAAGRAVASIWRPRWQIVFYTALLAAALRFFDYALGGGDLLVPGGFLLSWMVLLGFAALRLVGADCPGKGVVIRAHTLSLSQNALFQLVGFVLRHSG